MSYRVGIDTGGTFTDCVVFDEVSGKIVATKVPSTPDDPSVAACQAMEKIEAEHGIGLEDVALFVHGTTVATNAMLQGKMASVGVVCTKGFRDVLEIGTGQRAELYDLSTQKPAPLSPRPFRVEVDERTAASGAVLRAPKPEDVASAVAGLIDQGVDSVAICFLFSFVNPSNEDLALHAAASAADGHYVCSSSSICPEFREYDRWSTTVINAALTPVVSGYLKQLAASLGAAGLRSGVHVMSSTGGIMTDSEAQHDAAHELLLSGPAGGVVGASHAGHLSGYDSLITMDMGGTSCDVGLVVDGEPRVASRVEVEGWYPLLGAITDIHTIGSGGGSIAWLDSGGLLRVGPESAGAVPGPACYGKGGTSPTVTDANLLLGRLRPEGLLGGEMALDRQAAENAIEALAKRLQLSSVETALGILDVANSSMEGAIRVVTTMRGHDPRDFALLASGGAGALHATSVAEEIGVPRVIVPEIAGLLSAYGLLSSDMKHEYAFTCVTRLGCGDLADISRRLHELENRAKARLVSAGVGDERCVLTRSVDVRYCGQAYCLNVPLAAGDLAQESLAESEARFHAAHRRMYGQAASAEPVEFVTFRVKAVGVLSRPEPIRDERQSTSPDAARVSVAEVYFREANGFASTPIYARSRLAFGNRIEGPAVIIQMDSTTVLLPGQVAVVDQYRNVLISTRNGGSA